MSKELPTDYIEVGSIGDIIRVDSLIHDQSFSELVNDFLLKMESYGVKSSEIFVIPEALDGKKVEYFENEQQFIDKDGVTLTLPAGSYVIESTNNTSLVALYNHALKNHTRMAMDSELKVLVRSFVADI